MNFFYFEKKVIIAGRGIAEYRSASTVQQTQLYMTLLRATGDVADWVKKNININEYKLIHTVVYTLGTGNI